MVILSLFLLFLFLFHFHFTISLSPLFRLAMIRDENKVVVVQKQSTKPIIMLYTSSGRQMGTIQWDKGRIVGMGWTDAEQLICVLDDGTVRIYSIHGEYTQFSLGKVHLLSSPFLTPLLLCQLFLFLILLFLFFVSNRRRRSTEWRIAVSGGVGWWP